MLKIGLTGGIGSGKTTVARVFEILGIPVYDADAATKALYDADVVLKEQLIHHFGKNIYSDTGLNRQALASIVFNDPQKLHLLNQLVHPRTIRHAELWMEKQTAPYVIKEAALIFESGSGRSLDYIIGVSAPLTLRMQRVLSRDKVKTEDFYSRSSHQIDDDIKMKLCDFIIVNNEQEMVIPQVLKLHEKFIELTGGS